MTLGSNLKLGPYQILAPLGSGGMGEVYRARDTRLDREVAIKVLPEQMARDMDRIARFEREAKVLATLNHPNIAAIYGFEEYDGKRLLVMELVEGNTLAQQIKNGALPVGEALSIGRQMAEALEAAHERGIIHRDLKPANVKITPEGKVKVLDFGLAKAMDTAEELSATQIANSPTISAGYSPTVPGVILGTAAYMSPEQARGKPLDKRTDIWSFGVVLLECLIGKAPFGGETISDSIGAILHKEPDWGALPSDTPPTVHLLLRRCLAKDATRRLRDIGDARIELEHAIADPSSSSLSIARTAIADERRASSSRTIMVLLALIVTLLLGAVFGRQLMREPISPLRKYEIRLHDHGTWNVGQPAISPDGSMVAYVDQDRIWIRHLNSWEAREVEDSGRGVIPFWSPDSRWLAFGRGNELLKVPVAGGRPVLITNARGTFELIAGGAWSTDGRVFFSTGDAGIFVVPAEGGVAESYVAADQPDDDDFHELTLLPDGKTVVFTVHSRGRPWYLASFDGTNRKEVFSFGDHYAVTPAYSPTGHLLVQRFGDASSTWAVPFDADRVEVTGSPFLVADRDSDPSVSTTGTLALTRFIAGYFGGDLVRFDLETSEVYPFVSLEGVHHDHALSPDGKSLAVSGFDLNARNLWILDLENGSRIRLTFDETTNELLPRWSPDGSEIAYAKTSASAFERMAADDEIHFLSVNGSGETRPPIKGAFPSLDAEWKYIAFVRTTELTGRDIYFMPMDRSSEARSLLAESYVEEHPALSPDGRWLAYTSNESGVQGVYLTRFPDCQGKWQVSGSDGAFPKWSPDSTRIYYVGPEIGVYEVRLQLEPRVMLSTPRRIVDGPTLGIDPFIGLDVAADKKSLIVVRSRRGARPETIGVIENWFEEFRTR